MALIARDGGCSFPGCTHPPQWCDRHHILDWILGGPTDLDNLTLLCRYHHTHFLQKGWTCRINPDGLPEWIPPRWIDQHQHPHINTRIQRHQHPTPTRPPAPTTTAAKRCSMNCFRFSHRAAVGRRARRLLSSIADLPLAPRRLLDDTGAVRLVVPALTFEDDLELACGEIRRRGAAEPVVLRYLVKLLRSVGRYHQAGAARLSSGAA